MKDRGHGNKVEQRHEERRRSQLKSIKTCSNLGSRPLKKKVKQIKIKQYFLLSVLLYQMPSSLSKHLFVTLSFPFLLERLLI